MEDRRRRLRVAIKEENTEATTAILDEDETVMEQHDIFQHTALMTAADIGHAGIVDLLLRRGANANALAGLSIKKTALKLAAARGHLNVVNLLLEHGARVREGYPSDALSEACKRGHLAVVERLIEQGALQDGDNNVALILYASRSGSLDVLKAILWGGAFSNATMPPARHFAERSDKHGFVSLLQVSRGPSKHSKQQNTISLLVCSVVRARWCFAHTKKNIMV
jgi:ankyrin repeat protein